LPLAEVIYRSGYQPDNRLNTGAPLGIDTSVQRKSLRFADVQRKSLRFVDVTLVA
jgi:hypothetical protein